MSAIAWDLRVLEKLIEMTTGAVPRTHDHVCFALFERDRLFLTKSTWDYGVLQTPALPEAVSVHAPKGQRARRRVSAGWR